MKRLTARFCALTLVLAGITSSASAELIYGIAAVGNATNLVSWDSATPQNLSSGTFITGLQPNETIVGIDVRPANDQLYGLGSSSRLYQINPSTGVASAVGSQFSPLLNGFGFGFDFNPVIDRIRVVSETNKNMVLNPDTGQIEVVAADLFYDPNDLKVGQDPNIVHSAYSNNVKGAQTTQLYGIDSGFKSLVKQANNAGSLTTIGFHNYGLSLGGFDISGRTGVAYITVVTLGGYSDFTKVDIATGNFLGGGGQVGGGIIITAMTVASTVPEPATMALAAIGLAALPLVRRRG